jgi:PAS domain S-box-containing protein
MGFITKMRKIRISTKLLAMVILIVIAFAVVVTIVGWSFSSVRKLVTEVSVAQLSQINETSHTVQEFSNLFSRIDLVRQTFFERDDTLKNNGEGLLKDLKLISVQTTDVLLLESLNVMTGKLPQFLTKCAEINLLLAQRRKVDSESNKELDALEELISKRLINYTRKGADTYYLDQTLSLVTGYRENLLVVGKLHAEHFYAYMGQSGEMNDHTVIKQLDDLFLRLQTITAEAPEIASYGKRLVNQINRYRTIEQNLESSLKELDRLHEQIKLEQKNALEILEEINQRSLQTSTLVAGTISRIVNSAEIYVISVSLFIVMLTILFTITLIRSSINRPLKKIISDIAAIKDGSFREDKQVIRDDEWGVIEQSLRVMHEELDRSSAALRENEHRFRSIFNNSPIAIGIGRKENGKLIDVNKAWLQMFGFEQDDVLGRTPAELNLFLKPNERNELIRRVEELGQIVNYDVQMRRRTGEIIIAQLSAQLITLGNESVLQVMMTDITGHKLTEEKLQKKNADMEQFIYTVSHDLRSPLVTVKTFLGFLESDMSMDDRDRVSQDLQYIHGAADRMKLLLDELLELSRIDRVESPPVNVSLSDVLDEVLGSLAGAINERNVDIHLPVLDMILFGDISRFCQIWQNLIENAIKYSREDSIPRIDLGVKQINEEMVFFVKDNGIGIAPQYISKIFGIFEKLDPKSPGAGLGLSMINRIIEKGGGRVWAESEGIGKGSSFYFTLPNAVVHS